MSEVSTFAGPFKPGDSVDRYVIERPIGGGGAALVYLVRHTHLDTMCALKVLAGPALPHQTERILREGRVQAKLRHPNLVRVIDAIEVMGAPALVMEYVEGPTLGQWLHKHRPTLQEAESLFRGIVAAVSEAHRHGLVHRDLKPANVLLARVHGRLEPRVTDFGLVKVYSADEQLTQTGAAAGTPRYMAPEQIRDATNVDARTDVFALGAILYELVTGSPAFEGSSGPEVLRATLDGVYRPARERVPELPDRVVLAIEGCLKVDRRQRLPSCEALLGVLDKGLDTWETLLPPVPESMMPPPRRGGRASLRLAGALLIGVSLPIVAASLLLIAVARRGPPPTPQPIVLLQPVPIPAGTGAAEPEVVVVAPAPVAIEEVPAAIGPRAPACEGKKRELLGWMLAPGNVAPAKGDEIAVSGPRNVRVDYPRAENGFAPGEVVCVLSAGTKVRASKAPVQVDGSGWWVPVTGGSLEK